MRIARVVSYEFKPGTVEANIQKAREGLLPIFRRQPGFASYSVLQEGPTGIISVSVWESLAAAEQANRLAAEWVKRNLGDAVVSARAHIAEVAIEAQAHGVDATVELHH